jgi:integrase
VAESTLDDAAIKKVTMAKEVKSVRGIWENPPGSGDWWINYYIGGVRHREKVGRKQAAVDLYRKRKTDALEGRKLPKLRSGKAISLSDLIDDAVEFAKTHNKSAKSYVVKGGIVRKAMGDRDAASITPQEIDRWLKSHCKTPATSNRYKSFLSLCFREGIVNGKVASNPARLVRQRRENNERLRFLSSEEYDRLAGVIAERYPEQLPSFVVSVHTGMRLSEQFTVTWSQIKWDRRVIELNDTKNGSARSVALNETAFQALNQLKSKRRPKPNERVFHCNAADYVQRWWFEPALKAAEISGYVWHSNRHTFCSWLAMSGATLKEIQELAGHKTIQMSARYAHLNPAHKLAAVERIAKPGPSTATAESNSHQNSHKAKTIRMKGKKKSGLNI